MDVQKLINELAEKEITLWCEGANLKYKAPKGASAICSFRYKSAFKTKGKNSK